MSKILSTVIGQHDLNKRKLNQVAKRLEIYKKQVKTLKAKLKSQRKKKR
jgi:hypothetical protein